MTKEKVVEMFMVGFDPPAIAGVVGWSEVQRLRRKAQRWVRIKPC
jgi:hypothetical protein